MVSIFGGRFGRWSFLAGASWLVVFLAALVGPRIARAQTASQDEKVKALIGNSVPDPNNPNFKEVGEAIAQLEQGLIDEARKKLESAHEKNRQLPPAEIMLARLLLAAVNVPNSQELVRQRLELSALSEPNDPEAYLILGDLAFQQGRITDSSTLFERAGALLSGYDRNLMRKKDLTSRYYAGMAAVAEARGQSGDAEKNLRQWVANDDKSAVAKTRLARVLFDRAAKLTDNNASLALEKEAFQLLQDAYKLDSNLQTAEVTLAVMYQQADKEERASTFMTSAVKNYPTDLKTRLAVAQWAIDTGRIAEAKTNADEALKLDPKSLEAKLLVGIVARFQKDAALAEKMFRDAHMQSPLNFAALNHWALTLIETNDEDKRQYSEEVAQLCARAYATEGNTQARRDSVITLAWVVFRLGREREAEQLLLQVINAGAISPESAYLAAKILSSRGNDAVAKQILEPIINNKLSFPFRDAAEELLAQIVKRMPPAPNN